MMRAREKRKHIVASHAMSLPLSFHCLLLLSLSMTHQLGIFPSRQATPVRCESFGADAISGHSGVYQEDAAATSAVAGFAASFKGAVRFARAVNSGSGAHRATTHPLSRLPIFHRDAEADFFSRFVTVADAASAPSCVRRSYAAGEVVLPHGARQVRFAVLETGWERGKQKVWMCFHVKGESKL
jgi:hypothetical protein